VLVPGKGSAIFLHLAQPDYAPTEGCVALSRNDLLEALAKLTRKDRLIVQE
jgi:L,D-peptidoglycan transpeptidase YkuD (ErfK/YbiS/YcfS/YnhG family)